MAAPCDDYPLLIMMEYYRRPGGDVKKSSGRPRRGSLGEKSHSPLRMNVNGLQAARLSKRRVMTARTTLLGAA